jgi:transposase
VLIKQVAVSVFAVCASVLWKGRRAFAGFKVVPRRWVVERTFGWMIRWRRQVRGYEQRIDVQEAMLHLAMGSLLLRRISH